MVKRCKSVENRLENVLDISVLLKNIETDLKKKKNTNYGKIIRNFFEGFFLIPIKDRTMCNVTLDNSVDLDIDKFRQASTKMRSQIQNRKNQLYELRAENEKLLELVKHSRFFNEIFF